MSYQALARKWRPQNFQELVGQDHVAEAFTHALNNKRMHHAYLFTGTRGVGKTTIGRILAKCLNCHQGLTSTPCGDCDACQEISAGNFVDLLEIDAASRTKVEDTRDLLDNVQYSPTNGRYKIYLIDEVHMLSNHSFNALLKTLEEPPSHVVFILATTDPERLPATVLSRCLRFHLKSISEENISKHLTYVCLQENIQFEDTALIRLARSADGSMRDGLSLLDMAIAQGNGQVNINAVTKMLGLVDSRYLYDLLLSLQDKNADKILETIKDMSEQSIDFMQAIDDLLIAFHHLSLQKLVTTLPLRSVLREDELKSLAKNFTPEAIQLFYQIALKSKEDCILAPNMRIGFEMMMLRMLAFAPAEIAAFNSELELKPKQNKVKEEAKQAIVTNTQQVISKEEKGSDDWYELLTKLDLGGITKTLAVNCVLKSFKNDFLELMLSPKHAPLYNANQEKYLTDSISAYLQRKIKIKIEIIENNSVTPAMISAQKGSDKKNKALDSINRDPNIQAICSMFSGNPIADSIEYLQDD